MHCHVFPPLSSINGKLTFYASYFVAARNEILIARVGKKTLKVAQLPYEILKLALYLAVLLHFIACNDLIF